MTQAEIPGRPRALVVGPPLSAPPSYQLSVLIFGPLRMALVSPTHSQNATRASVECDSCKPNPHISVTQVQSQGEMMPPSPPTLSGFNNPAPALRDDYQSLLWVQASGSVKGLRKKSKSGLGDDTVNSSKQFFPSRPILQPHGLQLAEIL